MARTPWVGGNWKSNGTVASISELSKEFNQANFDASKTEVVIFPTALHIPLAREKLKNEFEIGCQNISQKGPGAFTGEIAAEMVSDLGLKWVMIGHSERRQFYGETDEVVVEKVKMAAKQGLYMVVCIGENLQERESNKTMAVCRGQLEAFAGHVMDWSRVVIAYEPVWAIGTGKVATPEQAQEVHREIRSALSQLVSAQTAAQVRIVYGGSVNAANAGALAGAPDVDGFLVGGASLKKDFLEIISAANKA